MSADSAPKPWVIAWIAAGLGVLPFLQALPTDQDRIAPLLILLPVLWGCHRRRARFSPQPPRLTGMEQLLIGWLALAAVIAVAASRHAAASLVIAGGWILLARFSLEAAFLARREPRAARIWLEALVAGAAVAAVSALTSYAIEGNDVMFPYPHHRLIGFSTIVGICAASHLLSTCVTGSEGRDGRPARPVQFGQSSSPDPRAARPYLTPGRLRFFLLLLGASAIWTAGLWSGSRGPLAALAGTFFIWFLRTPAGGRWRLTWLTALPFAIGLVCATLLPSQGAHLGVWNAVERTTTATGSLSELSSTRSDFWLASWHHYLTSPVWGLGPDAYRYLTPSMDGLQPHNFLLQWLLDFGILGALPLLAVALLALRRGWSAAAGNDPKPWAAIFTASLLAGSLDGNLYHFLGLFPAMLATGFCLSAGNPAGPRRDAAGFVQWLAPVATTLAIVLGLGFTVLQSVISFTPTPRGWDAPLPRALRAFPVTTLGVSREVSRWVTDWTERQPADALAGSRWAQDNTSIPFLFHLHAAQILQRQGDGPGTLRELQAAWEKAHRLDRPDIEKMIDGLTGGSHAYARPR
ncbi:MAG TPA: O-antigen ligase family protein [Lacunisphaera sp.]|nr:O-antigen ligase family protein [Lacunisphaera sp.]